MWLNVKIKRLIQNILIQNLKENIALTFSYNVAIDFLYNAFSAYCTSLHYQQTLR